MFLNPFEKEIFVLFGIVFKFWCNEIFESVLYELIKRTDQCHRLTYMTNYLNLLNS